MFRYELAVRRWTMSQPIQAEPLNFTRFTGLFGALAGGAGAVFTPILGAFTDVSDTVLVGILAATGAAFIALGIAAGADVLARAYATAGPKGTGPEDAEKETEEEDTAEVSFVALPVPLDVKFGNNVGYKAIMVKVLADDKISYLVAKADEQPSWQDEDKVTLAGPPTVSPQLLTLPRPLDVNVEGDAGYKAFAALVNVPEKRVESYVVARQGRGMSLESEIELSDLDESGVSAEVAGILQKAVRGARGQG
jgi:hypothetical protein